jgi:hypothetical protein
MPTLRPTGSLHCSTSPGPHGSGLNRAPQRRLQRGLLSGLLWSLLCGGWVGTPLAMAQKFEPNYDEAKVPQYELPALWNGPAPQSAEAAAEAWQPRRAELIALFSEHMFGYAPPTAAKLAWQTVEEGTFLDGRARRKQIRVTLSTSAGELPIDLLLYTPAAATGPTKTFLGLNFTGNHGATSDPAVLLPQSWMRPSNDGSVVNNRATEAGRGSQGSRMPLEMILAAGCGIATAYYGDIDPDFDDGFDNGVHALFPEHKPDESHPNRWGSIAAWAWGLSRLLDVLEQQPEVNAQQVIVFGHSRLGKTALWAGATDTRFAGVISNDSGCGGAALSRRAVGETVWRINTAFPHWFCRNFRNYNNQEAALPIDQHQLLALAAPRMLHVASASEDLWADPRGEFLATREASRLYEQLGLSGLKLAQFPAPGEGFVGRVSYHLRTGKHDLADWDWQLYLAAARANP